MLNKPKSNKSLQSAYLKDSNGNTITQIIKYSGVLDELTLNLDMLERIINDIYSYIEQKDKNDLRPKDNFKRDIIRKNKINKLSEETYNTIIKENVEEYFEIRSFLSNSANIGIKRKYLAIRDSLYPGVIAAINEGKTMDEVLSYLNSKFSNYFNDQSSKDSDESFIKCSGFFYYMYYICDLGKNE